MALDKRTLLIHLQCSPDVELARIRHRRRKQEATISVSYLAAINDSLNRKIAALRNERVLVIDANQVDFAHIEADKQFALHAVQDALPRGTIGRDKIWRCKMTR
jgi:deoxyadenosine/deoxycytidine kinase